MINILVVEDDERLNKLVCTCLNDSGFQAKGCLRANDAYEAMYNTLAFVKQKIPQVIENKNPPSRQQKKHKSQLR